VGAGSGPWRQAAVPRSLLRSGGTGLPRRAGENGARQRPRPRRCPGNRSTAGGAPRGEGRLLGNSRADAKAPSSTRSPLPEERRSSQRRPRLGELSRPGAPWSPWPPWSWTMTSVRPGGGQSRGEEGESGRCLLRAGTSAGPGPARPGSATVGLGLALCSAPELRKLQWAVNYFN